MADEQQPASNAVPSQAMGQAFWLAVAGMICLLVLAVAALLMAFLMGRDQPGAPSVTITNNSNNVEAQNSPSLPAATPGPVNRPAKPADASRNSEQMAGAPAFLPGPTGDKKTLRENAAQVIRADTQSPPYYSTLTPVSKVHLRIAPDGPTGLRGPMPFRVRHFNPGADGRVASVSAGVPVAGQEDAYSFLPDVVYRPSAAKGAGLSVEVHNPRKTSTVNDLRAPKGFQFFVAELRTSNGGETAIPFEQDMFEIRDAEQVVYLPNPELLGQGFPAALAPGGKANFMTAYLVPADAGLSSLVTTEPGGALLTSPLTPR